MRRLRNKIIDKILDIDFFKIYVIASFFIGVVFLFVGYNMLNASNRIGSSYAQSGPTRADQWLDANGIGSGTTFDGVKSQMNFNDAAKNTYLRAYSNCAFVSGSAPSGGDPRCEVAVFNGSVTCAQNQMALCKGDDLVNVGTIKNNLNSNVSILNQLKVDLNMPNASVDEVANAVQALVGNIGQNTSGRWTFGVAACGTLGCGATCDNLSGGPHKADQCNNPYWCPAPTPTPITPTEPPPPTQPPDTPSTSVGVRAWCTDGNFRSGQDYDIDITIKKAGTDENLLPQGTDRLSNQSNLNKSYSIEGRDNERFQIFVDVKDLNGGIRVSKITNCASSDSSATVRGGESCDIEFTGCKPPPPATTTPTITTTPTQEPSTGFCNYLRLDPAIHGQNKTFNQNDSLNLTSSLSGSGLTRGSFTYNILGYLINDQGQRIDPFTGQPTDTPSALIDSGNILRANVNSGLLSGEDVQRYVAQLQGLPPGRYEFVLHFDAVGYEYFAIDGLFSNVTSAACKETITLQPPPNPVARCESLVLYRKGDATKQPITQIRSGQDEVEAEVTYKLDENFPAFTSRIDFKVKGNESQVSIGPNFTCNTSTCTSTYALLQTNPIYGASRTYTVTTVTDNPAIDVSACVAEFSIQPPPPSGARCEALTLRGQRTGNSNQNIFLPNTDVTASVAYSRDISYPNNFTYDIKIRKGVDVVASTQPTTCNSVSCSSELVFGPNIDGVQYEPGATYIAYTTVSDENVQGVEECTEEFSIQLPQQEESTFQVTAICYIGSEPEGDFINLDNNSGGTGIGYEVIVNPGDEGGDEESFTGVTNSPRVTYQGTGGFNVFPDEIPDDLIDEFPNIQEVASPTEARLYPRNTSAVLEYLNCSPPVVRRPDLEIRKNLISSDYQPVGSLRIFSIEIENTGEVDITNFDFEDSFNPNYIGFQTAFVVASNGSRTEIPRASIDIKSPSPSPDPNVAISTLTIEDLPLGDEVLRPGNIYTLELRFEALKSTERATEGVVDFNDNCAVFKEVKVINDEGEEEIVTIEDNRDCAEFNIIEKNITVEVGKYTLTPRVNTGNDVRFIASIHNNTGYVYKDIDFIDTYDPNYLSIRYVKIAKIDFKPQPDIRIDDYKPILLQSFSSIQPLVINDIQNILSILEPGKSFIFELVFTAKAGVDSTCDVVSGNVRSGDIGANDSESACTQIVTPPPPKTGTNFFLNMTLAFTGWIIGTVSLRRYTYYN